MKRWACCAVLGILWLSQSTAVRAQPGMPHGGHQEPVPFAPSQFGEDDHTPQGPGGPIPPGIMSLRSGYASAFDDEGSAISCPDRFFYVEGGARMLKPFYDFNAAFFTFSNGTQQHAEMPTDFDVAPWVEVGFQLDNGWGFRADYSNFDNTQRASVTNTDPNTIIQSPTVMNNLVVASPRPFLATLPFNNAVAAGLGDVFTAQTSIRQQVADGEVTHYIECGCAIGSIGLGGRYANIRQTYTGERRAVPGVIGGATLIEDSQVLDYQHRFSGGGPLLTCELGVPVADGIRLFCTSRGSVLFGDRTERANLRASTIAQVGAVNINVQQSTARETTEFQVMPIVETEAGLELRLGSNVFCPYMKVGGVAQYWVGGGNSNNPRPNVLMGGFFVNFGLAF